MKVMRGIGLFFIYPAIMLGIGFLCGILFMNYFYPGKYTTKQQLEEDLTQDWQRTALDHAESMSRENNGSYSEKKSDGGYAGTGKEESNDPGTALDADNSVEDGYHQEDITAGSLQANSLSEKITADTDYVLEETDVLNKSVVETTWKIPAKYIGMNREQFLEAMEDYELSPPLAELERGFVSLEVLSFSPEKVVVQMNYQYIQPSTSFYLKVEDNNVVVYLDDQKTVYMYTDIMLPDLPDRVQRDIINVMYVPDEESLYNFLETYSS